MARKQLNSKQENNAQTEVETAEETPVSATLMPPRPKMESPEAAECAGESSSEIDAVPKTETGEEEGKTEFSDTEDSDGTVSQTETEGTENVGEFSPGIDADGAVPQTETGEEENKAEFSAITNPDGAVPQTETGETPDLEVDTVLQGRDTPKSDPPVAKRAGKKAAASQSDTDEVAVRQIQEDAEGAIGKAVKKSQSPRRKSGVLTIDGERTVETEADKARNDLIDLTESFKTGRILSGTIQGVERPNSRANAFAVIYHGAFKVIVPAEEAVEAPDDLRDQTLEDVLHYLLTKRLGAEVDYIVKGVDADAGIAVASRLEAMRAKRRDYYFGTDRDGNNLIYPGLCAEARVVSVIRAGIFVDLFGLEVYVPLRELSYQRIMDAAGYFQPGQRILVKVTEVDRGNRNQIKVSASVKQAAENPYEKALRMYTEGNRYVGTVSMVDTNGVFVALDGGIDCLCSYPKRGRPPRGARVTVRILGINHESNRIWGAITHIAVPR